MLYPSDVSIRNGIRKCFNGLSKKVIVRQTVRRTALEYMKVVDMLATMCIIKLFKLSPNRLFFLNQWFFYQNVSAIFHQILLVHLQVQAQLYWICYLLKIILKKIFAKGWVGILILSAKAFFSSSFPLHAL